MNWMRRIGNTVLSLLESMGGICVLFWKTLPETSAVIVNLGFFIKPLIKRKQLLPREDRLRRQVLDQMHKIGISSFALVALTGLFTGIVMALQSAYQLMKFSAIRYNADLVALSITRELGPVLTAMVVAGRVGAAITAEIGTMKVTQQVDALESMGTNPVRYLVSPRFLAAMLMLPILTIYFDFIGMLGGYLVSVFKLEIPSPLYIRNTFRALIHSDVLIGLFKAWIFGMIISIIGCYYGFRSAGGAEGVGRSTTMSVVGSLMAIIVADCFFTALFYFAS